MHVVEFGEEDTQVGAPGTEDEPGTDCELMWVEEDAGGELILRITPVRRAPSES